MIPPPTAIAAAFWRGGTSRGLLFSATTLAHYSPEVRNNIIRTALGSPDPAGRQISGLGGGVSSLSKACIVGVPGEGSDGVGGWPGVPWADDGEREGLGRWDLIYRFGQVGVRDTGIDWHVLCFSYLSMLKISLCSPVLRTATCGNMLAALALSAISTPLLPYTTLFTRSRSLPPPPPGSPLMFPLSILSASNGIVLRARVPIDPLTLQVWEPKEGEGCVIAGVPGEGVGVEVEMPIQVVPGVEGGLVTGRPQDSIELDGQIIPISILSSGLPNIFLSTHSLSLPPTLLTLPTSSLTSHSSLPTTLERIRVAVATKYSIPLSLASPKIVLLSPSLPYTTSGGEEVKEEDSDLLVRAVSSGDFHATIPGTTLGALNLGLGIPNTIISEIVHGVGGKNGQGEVVRVRAGHAAGVAESRVRFERGRARSVVMMRTAREIMRGSVMVPSRCFEE